MKIRELLNHDKVSFSCEIFPPKKDRDFSEVFNVVDQISELGADYIATGHYARIRHLENGRYNPSLKLAMDIAKVFHVTVEDLFEFTDS